MILEPAAQVAKSCISGSQKDRASPSSKVMISVVFSGTRCAGKHSDFRKQPTQLTSLPFAAKLSPEESVDEESVLEKMLNCRIKPFKVGWVGVGGDVG